MNMAQKPPSRLPKPLPRAKRTREDQEFLPAALEILETPPSPIRMAFILFIVGLAISVLAWTWLGKFDIVATAQGKIQPAGRVKVIQSAVLAKVVSPPVANSQVIKAGDVLLELDSTETLAEKAALTSALSAWRAEAIRREASLATIAGVERDNLMDAVSSIHAVQVSFPDDISTSIKRREQEILEAELAQLTASLNALKMQRKQQFAETSGLAQAIEARVALISTLSQRVDMRSTLVDSRASSRASVIDAIEVRQKEEADLAEMRGRLLQAEAAIAVTEGEAQKLLDTFIAENRQKYSDAARQIDELTQNLIKAESRLELMTIRSPSDGRVQASAITTIGQIVQPGAELMRIVPDNTALEIEAYLPNRDVGFVTAGQLVVVKVEAFPFTRFGTIDGTVQHVATDAIPEPDAQQLEQAASKELQSIVPIGNVQRMQNLVFPITIKPNASELKVGGRAIPLSPGMAVTVEIKTGERRILEYLFSPIAQVTSEAMEER